MWASDGFALAAVVAFVVGGVVLGVVDVRTRKLPDRLLLATALGVLASLVASAWHAGDPSALVRAGVGALVMFVVFLGIALAVPGELGFGDVKLAGVVGLMTGWFGWLTLLAAAVLTFVLAGAVAIGLLMIRRAGRRSTLPLGPFMILGALAALGVAAL
ncbi:A24 family peptidase [Cellulomonas fimi]|uniref:Prepilin peptidase n=1 Tax=Cellulomonas fimi TaxID=1708 RepID=A0A7Y0QGM0_CELFI|nr:A24 family peptidase [Cellulomonas fimi]NMR19233.1 prepilin peptidase [Cellulomonas fimi]